MLYSYHAFCEMVQDRSGFNSHRYGSNSDRYGSNSDRSGSKLDRSGSKLDRSGSKLDRYGSNSDRYGSNSDRSGSNSDRFCWFGSRKYLLFSGIATWKKRYLTTSRSVSSYVEVVRSPDELIL